MVFARASPFFPNRVRRLGCAMSVLSASRNAFLLRSWTRSPALPTIVRTSG